ncbi:MAG: hypothetical protein GX994_02170 [Firmicutes bacterium]|nr:hypothetical protein [Bacillota bacterium]
MVVCNYAKAKTDASGRIEYYCMKLAWRMELDGLEHCKDCPHYVCEKQAGSK